MTKMAFERIAEGLTEALAVARGDHMTIGETRVRLTFNPDHHSAVDTIKRKTADLIDICYENKDKDPRLAELAMTAYEEAAMWAVKLATATMGTTERK